MNFDEYQRISKTTRTEFNSNVYDRLTREQFVDTARFFAGVAGESGELNEAWKKFLRGDYDLLEFRGRVIGECGDILWYLSQLLDVIGVSFDEVAIANIDKLSKRREAGTIKGSGEDR